MKDIVALFIWIIIYAIDVGFVFLIYGASGVYDFSKAWYEIYVGAGDWVENDSAFVY